MKKIFYTSLIMASLFYTGCDSFLEDTAVINTENLDSGFKTEKNTDEAMVGIYAEIKSSNGLMGRNCHVLLDCSTTDLKITRDLLALTLINQRIYFQRQ